MRQCFRFSARIFAAALLIAGAFGSVPATAQPAHSPPPVEEIGPTVESLEPSRGAGIYPVFASVDLHAGSASARKALIIIHGRLRNASDYYATGVAIAKAAGPAGEATVVIAPQFLSETDVAAHHLSDGYLRWRRGWEEGAPAQGPASLRASDPPASSYDVLDDIVAKLSNASAFPSLRKIVFVGHGGGAQMLARYAVVMKPRPGPPVRFVIANAGTYLYPMTPRPVALACPDFNLWKYGFDQPPPYVGDTGAILKDFAARDVTLLLGSKDRKTTGILDQSCAAQTQGRNRLQRGKNFVHELTMRGVAPLLQYLIVPNVGHDEKEMLLSSQAMEAIFSDNTAR
jgi:hypothetical protein